jgi:1-aminocyclopropane-1-carboxylate deaminase
MDKTSLHDNEIKLSLAKIEPLDTFDSSYPRIRVDVLRLDLVHPVVSGNKYFKLIYPLQAALRERKKGIITYGGAYSNHLLATACICHQYGLRSIGIVRGEEPKLYSPTLLQAINYGMELKFLPRHQYKLHNMPEEEDWIVVNEGGRSAAGIAGAATIMDLAGTQAYSHIACAVGTGTTMAGLMQRATNDQTVLGFVVLKTGTETNELENFVSNASPQCDHRLIHDYHFGGYAKKTPGLIAFMNTFFDRYKIPTDFVYTAKLFFGVKDLISKGFFAEDASVLIIHSGGLQGNRSLPAHTLNFQQL